MKTVYLDHAATTPVRPEVRAAMAPYLDDRFGNPSSMHRWGRQARNALEEARERVAAAIGAQRREIIFTGGGTEADNIAVLGRWRSACSTADRPGAGPDIDRRAAGPIVCSATEHKAVSAAAQCAAAEGAVMVVLGVDEQGRVHPDAVAEALGDRPCIVSVMWANNEVGTLQPVAEIGARCRAAGIAFHTDAVQAFGKVPVRVDSTPCDLLSLSAHKVAGPKGVGALYVRDAALLLPLIHGGGQERELRPGTENVAAAVGFATAAELAVSRQDEHAARMATLRDRLEAGLLDRVRDVEVNAPRDGRLANILSITIHGADQEAMLIGLDLEGVAASGAAACHSGTVKPSHVLLAMGRADDSAAVVRLSTGWTTTEDDIDYAIDAFARVVEQVRVEASL